MQVNGLSSTPSSTHRLRRILIPVCTLVILVYVLFPPLSLLPKANLIGYSICHQIPERSFHLGDHQLPLCARCTGTYIGVALGFAAIALLRRWHTGEMLHTGMVVVMVCFIAAMAIDGVNSYLSLFGTLPHLYTPHNWLRAATGSLNGMALCMIVFPVFNYTLRKHTQPVPPLRTVWELLALLAVDAAAIALVQSEPAWLLYPMAILTTAGVLWMLTLVNTMILLLVFRQDSQAETWRDIALPLLSGLVVTLVELTVMGAIRYAVTGTLGWPLAT
jgi:uncharacterized membrane protein